MRDFSDVRKQFAQEPRFRHWEMYRIFESDLLNISRFITISSDNYMTYSAELSSNILKVCCEIEKFRKRMTGTNDNKSAILKICELFPEFASVRVVFPLWSLVLSPWESLPLTKPSWWEAYQAIKHDALRSITCANLENYLNALSGLFLVLIYYDRIVYSTQSVNGDDSISFDLKMLVSELCRPNDKCIQYGYSMQASGNRYWNNIYEIRWLRHVADE